METMCFMVDLNTNGAMPVQCKIRMEKFNLVVTILELDIEFVLPLDAIQMVSTDNLHG